MHDIAIPDLGILESLQAWPMAKRQTGSSEDPDTDQIRKALMCKRVTFWEQMHEAAPGNVGAYTNTTGFGAYFTASRNNSNKNNTT